MEELLIKLLELDIKLETSETGIKVIDPENKLSQELTEAIRVNEGLLKDMLGSIAVSDKSQVIEKAKDQSHYVLSSAQRRMYFLHELDKQSLAYNMPRVLEMEGLVDQEKLEYVFKSLIMRHESLRTTFEMVGDVVRQKINDQVDFQISYFNESGENGVSDIIGQFIRPFDLGADLPIRVGLIKCLSRTHILMVDMHHIISDGVSQSIFIRDFISLYNNQGLPELTLQYKDFSEWQQQNEQLSSLAPHREFWLKEFAEIPEVLDLPTDGVRPRARNTDGAAFVFTLDAEVTHRLRVISEKAESTLFMTLLSGFYVLLSKLSNQEDITVGTPIAGRDHEDLSEIMGIFINTLALRNSPRQAMTFNEFLETVKARVLKGFEHQSYPYEELIQEIDIPRDTSRNPLFDVMFAFQNFEKEAFNITDFSLKPYDSGHLQAKIDLTLTATEFDDEIHFIFEYAKGLFTEDRIMGFARYFEQIIKAITTNPNQPIAEIDVLSEGERHQQLHEFNDTGRSYSLDKTVIDLFEEQVVKHPESLALTCEGLAISYGEFHNRVTDLAGYLTNMGVKNGAVVGVLCERSIHMLVAIFGIMKSGAAYLPLDPEFPEKRLRYMLEDSGASMVLVTNQTEKLGSLLIESVKRPLINMEKVSLAPKSSAFGSKMELRPSSEDLAYVIYTSGSTGRPKGVEITHRNIFNLAMGVAESLEFRGKTKMLAITTVSFDIFVLETILPLTVGAEVIIASDEQKNNLNSLQNLIVDQEVNTIQFTPSRLGIYLQEDPHLLSFTQVETLLVGGEALPSSLFKEVKENFYGAIYNLYGPTETSVWSMIKNLTDNEEITIGTPIANTEIYILNKCNQLQPVGVAGELYIGGKGVAKGYANDPLQTAEKFISNPFKPNDRIYRTGDLARWLPDGEIAFLGRVDDQVKVRGYRIETDEIVSQLEAYPNVQEAAVSVNGQGETKYLVAYYVSDTAEESVVLRDFLAGQLPDYMLPSYYVRMDQFPLTANGKLDKKSLPKPDLQIDEHQVGPENEIEEKLVSLWSEVLEIDKPLVGVTQTFFELGGHSLKALIITNKIFKEFNVKLSLTELFNASTIRNVSRWITSESSKTSSSAGNAEQDKVKVII